MVSVWFRLHHISEFNTTNSPTCNFLKTLFGFQVLLIRIELFLGPWCVLVICHFILDVFSWKVFVSNFIQSFMVSHNMHVFFCWSPALHLKNPVFLSYSQSVFQIKEKTGGGSWTQRVSLSVGSLKRGQSSACSRSHLSSVSSQLISVPTESTGAIPALLFEFACMQVCVPILQPRLIGNTCL